MDLQLLDLRQARGVLMRCLMVFTYVYSHTCIKSLPVCLSLSHFVKTANALCCQHVRLRNKLVMNITLAFLCELPDRFLTY